MAALHLPATASCAVPAAAMPALLAIAAAAAPGDLREEVLAVTEHTDLLELVPASARSSSLPLALFLLNLHLQYGGPGGCSHQKHPEHRR